MIHNQMEDLVIETMNDLFALDELKKRNICFCRACRMDIMCHALNRLSPEYIVSGRGYAFFKSAFDAFKQNRIDVIKCVKEAIDVVSQDRRPGHEKQENIELTGKFTPPVFNFPVFSGRFVEGESFSPIAEGVITLKLNGQPVKMLSEAWVNPCPLTSALNGCYTFWPQPIQAENNAQKRAFNFELELTRSGEKPISSQYNLTLTAENNVITSILANRSYNIPDKYVFSKSGILGEEDDF